MADLFDSQKALETSKVDMRKYIQLLIHRVLPVYKNVRSYVMQVTLNRGIEIPFTTSGNSEPTDNVPVYLIVDGIQGISPKLRYIYSPLVTFDQDNGTFSYDNTTITVREVFEDEEEEFSSDLLFRRLDIYQDDVPKNKKKRGGD
jgi:hypothetical protein